MPFLKKTYPQQQFEVRFILHILDLIPIFNKEEYFEATFRALFSVSATFSVLAFCPRRNGTGSTRAKRLTDTARSSIPGRDSGLNGNSASSGNTLDYGQIRNHIV